jgi:RNA polymerase sigma-70 factor (ECF subfamily)
LNHEANQVVATGKHTLNPDGWVDNYGDLLFNYAISRLYASELAEDMVQETFLSAFQAREKFKGESSEATWLIAILKRKIIDHYRKQSKNPEERKGEDFWPFIDEGADEGLWAKEHRPLEWTINQLDRSEEDLFMEVMRLCLSLLPEKMAATFTLRAMEEQTTENVCKELGISASNLWVLLHRARLQLRDCLEQKWFKN